MVEPEKIKDFCEDDLKDMKGPIAALMAETKDYISNHDAALEASIGKHMCKSTCPCVELDLEKWETSIQVELSKGETYRINDPDGYLTFENCYANKKTLWETTEDYIPIDKDALALEK